MGNTLRAERIFPGDMNTPRVATDRSPARRMEYCTQHPARRHYSTTYGTMRS